jgi:flagellar basal-body rod protein FlgG
MSGSIMNAFHIARSGLQMSELNLSVKSMNIAAQGADGYKKQYLVTFDLPYQDEGGVGTPTSDAGTINPTGTQVGLGVQSGGIYRDFSQGDPIKTENFLDLMIEGEGFFEVTLPDGTIGYTRVGALQVDGDNQIVMPTTGYPVVPGITLPSQTTEVSVNTQGQIYVITAGTSTQQLVGQLELATFFNPSGLKAIGDSMYLETTASGTPDRGAPGSNRRGTVKQGWREGSNVNAIEEMTDLIRIEKIYDMLTKILKTGDAMWSSATQIGR